MPKSTAVISPNLGLRFDKPSLALDPRELKDGLNFRVKEGTLQNLNLGWTRFGEFTLDGPVRFITTLLLQDSTEHLVFGTETSIYRWDEGNDVVKFISPAYVTGTAAASGTAVTGTGTSWDASGEVKAGDFIAFGANDETDPDADWFEIDSVGGDTSITLTSTAGTVSDGDYTIRRVFTGDPEDVWTHDSFVNAGGTEDRLYMSNGVDPLVRWNGTDDFAVSLDSFALTKIKALAAYQNMMIYANFEQSGTQRTTDIVNSDVGDPEDISSGLSEQFTVHSDTDPIRAIYTLADNLVIYSNRVLVVAQFIGDPLVFLFRVASTGVGTFAPNTVADFGDYHIFLGFDAQYRFDGVTVEEEGEHVWREVIRRNDPTRRAAAFAFFDEENGELIWVLGLASDAGSGTAGQPPERAWALHYLETVDPAAPQPYSQREFPFTAAGNYFRQAGLTWDQLTDTFADYSFRWNDQFFFASFPLLLVGDHDGKVYTLNTSQNKDDGSALASYVHFGRRPLADGRMRGLVRRVYPFVQTFSTDLTVTLGLSDHAAGPVTTTEVMTFDQDLPEGGHFVSPFRRGRFYELQFGTAGPSMPYVLEGFDTDATRGGYR